jgi:hypothetical protein
MIKAVAEHVFGVRRDPRKRSREYTPREADAEVRAIAEWLERISRKLGKGERLVTYRQLSRLLAPHGLEMANPSGNTIGIYRSVPVKRGLMRSKTVLERKHIATVPFPGDTRVVGRRVMKEIRRNCWLDDAHGVDSAAFYEGADVIDVFINEYRGILRKLARQ